MLLEVGLKQGLPDLGGQARTTPASLHRGHVPFEVAAPHGFVAQLEQDGVVVEPSPGLGPAGERQQRCDEGDPAVWKEWSHGRASARHGHR